MIYNNLSVENGEGNVPFFAFACLRSAGACLRLPADLQRLRHQKRCFILNCQNLNNYISGR